MTFDIRDDVPLAPLTTLELGGPARHLACARDEGDVADALRWAHGRGLPALLLGGGSNVVIGDAGFPGLVVQIATRGRRFETGAGEATVTAAAGEPWDDLVADTVARGLAGLECLSGIPGLVGATPIQNVGAYGQEVADTIRSVRVLERGVWRVRDLAPEDCAFGYRDSAFKRDPERFAVLAVTFGLRPGGAPTLRYRELADAFDPARNPRTGSEPPAMGSVEQSSTSPDASAPPPTLGDARRAVLALRRRKSMVIAADDPNRRSVGSFFTNPVLPAADAAAVIARAVASGAATSTAEVPRWPAPGDAIKLSAGWLVERAGIPRGFRLGAVGVSSAHALALVHHGGGNTAALLELARHVRDAVRRRFGVVLSPEPTLIGAAWETTEN